VSLEEDLPDDVKRAVAALVDSLDNLQVVLLVYRGRQRSSTIEEVALAVGLSTTQARRELEKMRSAGLAELDGDGYRYPSQPPAVDAEVALIAAAYGTHRIGLINHVASRALQRIRALADAFRLGKGKKDG
jgi:hypothetical protein